MTSTVMESTVDVVQPCCATPGAIVMSSSPYVPDPADVAGVQHGGGGVLLHDGRAR